jgi:NTP pyrophosphatase (non-canonical NTP hydrolase)
MTNTPTLDQLEALVLEWGKAKGILEHATPESQFRKTLEEVQEIADGLEFGIDEEILDGIGDTGVTLILLAALKGWTFRQCLAHAYGIISKRTGRMVDGMFVKDVPSSDDDLGELDASKACRVGDEPCESCQ